MYKLPINGPFNGLPFNENRARTSITGTTIAIYYIIHFKPRLKMTGTHVYTAQQYFVLLIHRGLCVSILSSDLQMPQ